MEISNLYDDLSSAEIQERATPVGQQLRVAVTKTSAQGKAAQSATPNLMSFSTDENSIWFNGKKYSTHLFKNKLYNLSTSSSHADITEALNGATFSDIKDFVARGIQGVVMVDENPDYNLLPVTMQYSEDNSSVVYFSIIYSNRYITNISIDMTSSSAYKVKEVLSDALLLESNVINSLASQSTVSPLSAAMGKKLNDEKLAKTDVVNNLTTTDTTKALSAAQGKALNDKISSLNTKLSSNFVAMEIDNLPEGKSNDFEAIENALGINGRDLFERIQSGATLVDGGGNHISVHDCSPGNIRLSALYVIDESCIITKSIYLSIEGTGHYTESLVETYEYPIPVVENSLNSNNTANALSAAQGKALNDRISALGSVYRVKGSKTNISEVLALTDAKVGDVWNVINAFTLNGKPFPASTNIVCVTATSSSDHDEGNWDPIGGTVDLSSYAKKTEVDAADNEIWEQLGVVVSKDEIINNLTSTNIDKPLSAAMGKKLQDEKLSKTDAGNTYLTKVNAESTYAKKADGISHYSIGELTALNSNPTQEQLKTALGTPSAFRNAIDAGKLILVTGHANVQSQKSATCIIDSGNVIVKYLHPGNNDWTVIAKCVPASSGDNWDNAQFSVRIIKSSDISYTTNLPDSLVVPQTIGGINKGTKVSDLEGSTISQMFDNLLFPEVQPTIQAPSATISFKDTFSSNGVYEVGTTAPTAVNFNTSFNRGTCTVVGQANKNRAGNLNSGNSFIYYGGNTSTKTLPAKVTLGTMQYNYHAAYAQGDTLVTSKGNKASVTPNPLPAGSVNSSNLTIFGTYPYYCNGQSASSSSGDSNFPTSATPDTKLPLYKWTDALVGAKFASEAATGTRMQFMYSNRKNVTKVEFYNSISGKWETFGTSNYNAKSGTKTYSVQGTNETYNILTTTGPLSGSVQYRFTMTNA